MNGRRPTAKSARAAKPANRLTKADIHAASPYGYAHTATGWPGKIPSTSGLANR